MKHKHRSSIHSNALYTICTIAFVYTLHLTLPMYVNSSFLGQFTDENTVGLLYVVGSILTIIGFLLTSRLLTRYGNTKATIGLISLQILLFIGLSTSDDFRFITFFFIASIAIVAMIGLNLDVYLEAYTDRGHAGGIRGMYMTIINIAWILSPLVGGALIDGGTNYRPIYWIALSILFLLLYIMKKNFAGFVDPHYPHLSISKTLVHISKNTDLVRIFAANIILNTFYAWMIIYSPIYLHTKIGLSWDDIGIIFTIMLLPFILFQLPLGKLADGRWGEKEIMTAGFIIMGISTYLLSFITSNNVVLWAFALFMTRVGASTAEIMLETYFFKKVRREDSDVLSMFRISRPIAYLIAPAVTGISLIYMDHRSIFMVVGAIAISALFFTLTFRDTK